MSVVRTRMRYWAQLFSIVILVSSGHFAWPSRADAAERCEHTGTAKVISPNAQWVIRVYGETCDLGLTSSASVKVDLALAAPGSSAVSILSIDMPSDKLQWPRPKWESSSRIVIQVPSNANVALQMASFKNVNIELRFCPGGLAEHAAWSTYRSEYHKWVQDLAAWGKLRAQDPGTPLPKPAAPIPPQALQADASCER